jgi:predicted PurR-regulated permease PerM
MADNMISLRETSRPVTEEQPKGSDGLGNMLCGLGVAGRTGAGLLILGVLYTIYFARSLLLPVLLALLLAAFLQPLVQRLNRLRIPDIAGAAIVVLLFVLALGGAIYQLSSPAADWVNRGPLLLQKADRKLSALRQSIKKAQEKTQQLEDIGKLEETKAKVAVKGPSLAERIFTQTWLILATAAVVLALIYFLLAQGRPTLRRLTYGLTGEEQGQRLTNLLVKIQQDIASYLTTISLIYLVVGMITAAAMALFGMPTPVLWGAVAAVLHFIPFLGPVITFVILCGVSLLTFDTWLNILLPPLFYFCLAGLEGYFITPMILGRRLTLNPIMVFGAILFWGWMWGILGVFLAVPILTSVNIICDDLEWLKPVGQILSSGRAKKEEDTRPLSSPSP